MKMSATSSRYEEPGPELDKLVGEAKGWSWKLEGGIYWYYDKYGEFQVSSKEWKPSHKDHIGDGWELVEEMKEEIEAIFYSTGKWYIELKKYEQVFMGLKLPHVASLAFVEVKGKK